MIRNGANAPAFSDAPPFALQRRVCAAGTATASSGAPPRHSEVAPFATTPPAASLTAASAPPVCSRGIGMMIESDFYSTQAGRDHFKDQLQSIRCTLAFRAAPPPPRPRPCNLTSPCSCLQTASRRWVSDHDSAPRRRPRSRLAFPRADLQLRRALQLPHVHQLRLPLRYPKVCKARLSCPNATPFSCAHPTTLRGLRPKRNVRQAMAHDLSQYAIVQKEGCVSALSVSSVHTFAFFIAHAFAPPPLAAWAWTSASRRPRRAWRGTRSPRIC